RRGLGNGREPGPDDQHYQERGWSRAVAGRASALLFERPRYNRHTPRHLPGAPRRSERRPGWGPPRPLGPDVNTTLHEAGPFYSQSAEDGSANLYFYRGSDNGATTDIYYAAVTRDGETRGPAVLVSELSYPGRPDGFVTVRADGKEILFNSGRPLTPGGPNAFDIWVSTRRSVHDAWSAPVNLRSEEHTSE